MYSKIILSFLLFLVVEVYGQSGECAFSAILSKTKYFKIYDKVKYDEIITNHGNAYNNATGIFTAPSSGLYVITWTTAIKWGQWQETELIHNAQTSLRTIADSYKRGDRSTATGLGVFYLNKDDTLHIRIGRRGDRVLRGDRDCTFSGWKLYNS